MFAAYSVSIVAANKLQWFLLSRVEPCWNAALVFGGRGHWTPERHLANKCESLSASLVEKFSVNLLMVPLEVVQTLPSVTGRGGGQIGGRAHQVGGRSQLKARSLLPTPHFRATTPSSKVLALWVSV